jgi:hypothetical protein
MFQIENIILFVLYLIHNLLCMTTLYIKQQNKLNLISLLFESFILFLKYQFIHKFMLFLKNSTNKK